MSKKQNAKSGSTKPSQSEKKDPIVKLKSAEQIAAEDSSARKPAQRVARPDVLKELPNKEGVVLDTGVKDSKGGACGVFVAAEKVGNGIAVTIGAARDGKVTGARRTTVVPEGNALKAANDFAKNAVAYFTRPAARHDGVFLTPLEEENLKNGGKATAGEPESASKAG